MRVAKTDTIAGLPAVLARSIVRKFRGREMVAAAVADLLEGTEYEHQAVLAELEAAGYMEKVRVDTDGDVGGTRPSRAMPWRWQASENRSAEKPQTAW